MNTPHYLFSKKTPISVIAIIILLLSLTFVANASPPFSITVSTAATYTPGSLVVVEGTLTSDGAAVANAFVTVEVKNPSGSATGPGGNIDIVQTDSAGKYSSQYRLPSNTATGTYRVKGIYKADVSASTTFTVATGGPDTTPPTITHTAVTTASPGVAVTITATITDNVGVSSATLFYRKTGEVFYGVVSMTAVGNTWSGTIPASAVTTVGLQYYIGAYDAVGNEGRTPTTAPGTPYKVTVSGFQLSVVGAQTQNATGAAKSTFMHDDAFLVVADISNSGSTSMRAAVAITVQGPDGSVLYPIARLKASVPAGSSWSVQIEYKLPSTAVSGKWTAKVLVFTDWPSAGGVAAADPVSLTFEVKG